MDNELISKKELLELTDISYGQLYRWKRKNLIPEEWFIKKSSFTGQETFFPRDKILERIDKIKNLKEDVSLDELAGVFSPKLANIVLSNNDLAKRNIVTEAALNIYKSFHGEKKSFNFQEILFLSVLEKFLSSGEAGVEEGKNIVFTLEQNYKHFKDENCDVLLIRKFGIAICILVACPNEIYIEEGAKLVKRINMQECIEELKIKVAI